MSPTSLVPGAVAVKSRRTRSGTSPASPARVVVGPPRPRLARHRAEFAHQPPHQLGSGRDLAADQHGVDPAVAVGAVGVFEDRGDDGLQLLAALRGGRGRPPAVE